MSRFTQQHALRLAVLIRDNGHAWIARRITREQFGINARNLWRQADRDEPRIINSDCDRRVMTVCDALNRLPA